METSNEFLDELQKWIEEQRRLVDKIIVMIRDSEEKVRIIEASNKKE